MYPFNIHFFVGSIAGAVAVTIFLTIYTDSFENKKYSPKTRTVSSQTTQKCTYKTHTKETQVDYDLADFIVVDYCPRM
jgi:hypothetical protein